MTTTTKSKMTRLDVLHANGWQVIARYWGTDSMRAEACQSTAYSAPYHDIYDGAEIIGYIGAGQNWRMGA